MIKKIKKIIRNLLLPFPSCCNIVLLLKKRTVLNSVIWGGKEIFIDEIKSDISSFRNYNDLSEKEYHHLIDDIVYCYLRFGSTSLEYFVFGFYGMSNSRRSEFLTNMHKDIVCIEDVGLEKRHSDLEDKYLFYKRCGADLFKRDVCMVQNRENKTPFLDFISKHSRFIVKPLNGQCGRGIFIEEIKSAEEYDVVFEKLLQTGPYIIEELIDQDENMSKWNESSINTVRIPSFYKNGEFYILKPFFRTGRRGSIVDNGAAGGILSCIDAVSGMIVTDGFDEHNHVFERHPDSGMQYKGIQLPQWEALLKMVQSAHKKFPDHKYIGWDFALSKDGWVLIEGDWGQFLSEFVDKEGIKDKFDMLMM